jgi:hypothetical protein
MNNMQSAELGQLIRWYNSVGGRIPPIAHTHKKSHKHESSAKDIRTITNNDGVEMAAIVTKIDGGSSGEDYHKRPPEENPRLKQWLLTKGIDVTNIDNLINHLTEEDVRVGKLERGTEEYRQWRKDMHAKLIMKLRRIHNNQRLTKLNERDQALESELYQIKQHLFDTDSIKEQNKVHMDQIYKAWVVVTNKRDPRVFKSRLHEYADAGYILPVDDKKKLFRVEEKLLAI